MSQIESVRDRIAARRRELQEESNHLDLTVAAWPDTFQVRYRLLNDAENGKFTKVVEKAQKARDNALARAATLDILIGSCECVLVPNAEEVYEPLLDDNEQPIRLDVRLAELLGLDSVDTDLTARKIAGEFFSPEGKFPDAIFDHAQALGNWRRGRVSSIDRDLLGE